MNIEEIKLITDTITTLGVQGKEAFIWWLVVDKVLPIFGFMSFFYALYKAAIHITFAVSCTKDIKRFYKKATGQDAPYFINEAHIQRIDEVLSK